LSRFSENCIPSIYACSKTFIKKLVIWRFLRDQKEVKNMEWEEEEEEKWQEEWEEEEWPEEEEEW